jgi:Raf kinase inhibitor-like YbhB/YbcL family protein
MKATSPIVLALLFLVSTGCEEETSEVTFDLKSMAFSQDEVIPNAHTCHGPGKSPQLYFSKMPDEAVGLIIVLEDLDHITGSYTHFMLWGIPADIIIPENIKPNNIEENLPEGAALGTADDEKTVGYLPPCAPAGGYHRFLFTAYALDKIIRLEQGEVRSTLDEAMDGHIIAKGDLLGRVPPKKDQ